ncbi:MAG TPA: altronate dehydratase family protein [Acidobacteriaceae bacterium]|nr:altronate dehydratase family protein [Acidobacteriaceae bacterium]
MQENQNPLPLLQRTVLQLDPTDNVAVALRDLSAGETVVVAGQPCAVVSHIPAKHKFALRDLAPGDPIMMYGVLVGKATQPIRSGHLIATSNVRHEAAETHPSEGCLSWTAPDVSRWQNRTFLGYHRSDGQVGTRNYWLVIPLVFCENRNIRALQQAFEHGLGFASGHAYQRQVARLAELYTKGKVEEIQTFAPELEPAAQEAHKLFPNLDGIRFLTHEGGCGGTREDARLLCGLIAGYIHHPNVAGATILSLGCQNAQISLLREEITRRDANFSKPLLIFDQQASGLEFDMLSRAIRETFLGLIQANKAKREAAPLSQLAVGLKCGGSDGFSGITANPAIGHTADLIAVLGGRTVLSEFPELCGVEQSLIDRCLSRDLADRYLSMMQAYAARAAAIGSGFDSNPSPGNIKDGIITDAMKSAGAVKKGGTSPVVDVLDYPGYVTRPGLNLLCTPGNDVEAVTGQVGAGANIVLFTTGLGTPTGNPIAPVVKLSTNSALANRMPDIIDFDCGPIVTGEKTIQESGEAILEYIIQVASGEKHTKAEMNRQEDFIPWKRGISL